MKKLLSKRVLVIVLPILLVVGLIGGGIVLLPRFLSTPLQIKISTGDAAAATPAAADDHDDPRAITNDQAPKKPYPALPYATRERVVNLADKGGYRYLKVEVVLDVVIPHSKPGDPLPKGAAVKEVQDEIALELTPFKPRIEDAITTTLSSKTSEELMTTEGKQRLRDELRAKLDQISVDHPVAGVYFTQFIIQ